MSPSRTKEGGRRAVAPAIALALAAIPGSLAGPPRDYSQETLLGKQTWTTGDQCTRVRLDDPGQSMANVPVDHQTMGICYAHAATYLYDAWRFSHGEDPKTGTSSPIEAASGAEAILRARQLSRTEGDAARTDEREKLRSEFRFGDLEGGGISTSLEHLVSRGSCADTALDRDAFDSKWISAAGLYREVAEQRSVILAGEQGMDAYIPGNSAAIEQARREIRDYLTRNTCEQTRAASTFAPALPLEDIADILELENPMLAMQRLVFASCGGQPRLQASGSPVVEEWQPWDFDGGKEDWSAKLRAHFSGPKPLQPLGLSYCSRVLAQGSSWDRQERPPGGPDYNCGAHASAIIGRESIGGQCGYWIQNSWGTLCEDHPPGPGVLCREGKYWIPERTLAPAIASLSWLRPPGISDYLP